MSTTLHRRDFIRKAGLASGAAVLAPYWLSAALNAGGNKDKSLHVVLCILGGGVRKSDTLGMQWGNLMPHMFAGTIPIDRRLSEGLPQLSHVFNETLQEQGTLFTQFSYAKGELSHYNAHNALLTGCYNDSRLSYRDTPNLPTIFDVIEREKQIAEIEGMGWIANALGNYNSLGGAYAVNQNLDNWGFGTRNVLSQEIDRTLSSWGLASIEAFEDVRSIAAASNYIADKRPLFTAFNLQGADCCHYDFSRYCRNLHVVDYALACMWKRIQDTENMSENTILIVVPEHGRNLTHNMLADDFGFYGCDHNDDTAREIFCLVSGPPHLVNQNLIIDSSVQTIDVAPTIAQCVGVDPLKISQLFSGRPLLEAFIKV